MSRKIYFKWLPSTNISETPRGVEPNNHINTMTIYTVKSLDQLVEAAKSIENLNNIKITVGQEYNILLDGISTPIQLISRIDRYNSSNRYEVSDEGPSLEWLLSHKEDLDNPNPSRIFYMNDTAIHFSIASTFKPTVTVSMLNTKHIDTYLDISGYCHMEKLDKSFDEFLKSYGYRDENMYRGIGRVIATFIAAKKLGFIDAEQVAASFNDEHLVVDLKLRGVFENIGKYCC